MPRKLPIGRMSAKADSSLCNIKRAADEQRSLIGCHDKCAILHGAGEVVHVERVVEQKHGPRRVLLGHGTAQTVEPRVQFGGGHGEYGAWMILLYD